MRNLKVDKDARALARNPDALRGVKHNIDLAVAAHDLAAINHWTSVWFKIQELTLGRATDADRDARSGVSRIWDGAGRGTSPQVGLVLSILTHVSELAPPIAAAVTALALGAVMLFDWLTGAGVSLLIGYIAIVGFASWTLGDRVAASVALLSALAISGMLHLQHDGLSSSVTIASEAWNFFVTAASLSAFAAVMGALRDAQKPRLQQSGLTA
jgi:hypothetical protein